MRVIFLFIAFFLIFNAFAQRMDRKLTWKRSIITNDNGTNIYMMNFEGADYPDLDLTKEL